MRAHPGLVGGDGRDVTVLMDGWPGLLAKDGAEGVYAAATADGRAVALKVDDGAGRARSAVLLAAFDTIGVEVPAGLGDRLRVQVLGWQAGRRGTRRRAALNPVGYQCQSVRSRSAGTVMKTWARGPSTPRLMCP